MRLVSQYPFVYLLLLRVVQEIYTFYTAIHIAMLLYYSAIVVSPFFIIIIAVILIITQVGR